MSAGECTCGRTACESNLCDCDKTPCPVDHAADETQLKRKGSVVMTDEKPPGRPLGGLLRIRRALRSERAKDLYWSAFNGVVGFGVGLLFVMAYLAYR